MDEANNLNESPPTNSLIENMNGFNIVENSPNNQKELLINKILNNYGYRYRMILLIFSSFFISYICGYVTNHVSQNDKIIKKNFSYISKNIEIILNVVCYTFKIIGCLTVYILIKYFGRYKVIKISSAVIVLLSIVLIFVYNILSYIIFLIISSYCAGCMETIFLDNICESLPIKFRGYSIYISTSGIMFNGLLASFINKCFTENNMIDNLGILITNSLIIIILFIFIFLFYKSSPRNLIIRENFEEAFEVLQYYRNDLILTPEEKIQIINESKIGLNKNLEIRMSEIFSKYFLFSTIIITFLSINENLKDFGFEAIWKIIIKRFFPNIDEAFLISQNFKMNIISFFIYIFVGLLLEIETFGRILNLKICAVVSFFLVFLVFNDKNNYFIWIILLSSFFSTSSNILMVVISETYPSKIRDASQGYFIAIMNFGSLLGQTVFFSIYKLYENFAINLLIFLSLFSFVLFFFMKNETKGRALDTFADYDFDNDQKPNLVNENDEENFLKKD